jgi:hypothetical protein
MKLLFSARVSAKTTLCAFILVASGCGGGGSGDDAKEPSQNLPAGNQVESDVKGGEVWDSFIWDNSTWN